MTDSQMTPPPEPNPGTESARPDLPPPPPLVSSNPPAPSVPPVPNAPVVPGAVPTAPPVASAATPVTAPASLDEGTYQQIREPRAAGRLSLDGEWHQISPRYVVSQFVQNGIVLALILAAALVVGLVFDQQWVWIPAGALALIEVFTLVILPRQARAIGYMLRADDIVFRKGILWQRVIAVPYGRMQLVDITHGPLDRAFGVAQLKMVTAAATTGVQIPGLTQTAAEALRDTLIDVAETRRTGL